MGTSEQPGDHSKRILLAAIGMAPKKLTETRYKITSGSGSSFAPSEIHLIATREGVTSIKHTLLGITKRDGWVELFYMVPERVLLEKNRGYQETVKFIQRINEPETIELNQDKYTVCCRGINIKMDKAQFAFYMWMCQRKLAGELPLNLDADAFMYEYLDVYSRFAHRESGMFDRAEAVAKEGDIAAQKRWFAQKKSKVNGCIGRVLGKRLGRPFLVQSVGRRGQFAYEIGLDREAICVR